MGREVLYNPVSLRSVAESAFNITDICPRYRNVGVGVTNVFCVFHDNHESPSARLYWDEDREIPVLHCFAEHKTFTSYDYIEQILVNKYRKYSSVQDYLIKNLGEQKFRELYSLAEQNALIESESLIEKNIEYINNLYSEHDNVIDFINCLYLEKE